MADLTLADRESLDHDPVAFIYLLLTRMEQAALSGEPEEVLDCVNGYRTSLHFQTPEDV